MRTFLLLVRGLTLVKRLMINLLTRCFSNIVKCGGDLSFDVRGKVVGSGHSL